MNVTIEIWQSQFNDEWNCNVTTSEDKNNDETEFWSVEDFCSVLNLISEKFPKAKCISK